MTWMGELNELSVEVYSSGTTRIVDPGGELSFVDGIEFSKGYPGGRYLDAVMQVRRDVLKTWQVKGARRLVIRNKRAIVYEGKLGNLERVLAEDAGQWLVLPAKGFWGSLLMRRRVRKLWADARIADDVWQWGEKYTAADIAESDRNGRLRIVPKNEAWVTGQYAGYGYAMPTGQTIKKITYDYAQGGTNMKLIFYDPSGTNADQVIVTGGGSGSSQTYTLTTPVQTMQLRLVATANHTPANDGSVYGEIFNVTVYSETSSVNMEEIFKDVAGLITSLSSYTGKINAAASALSLVPYIADDWATAADVLEDAASFGDANGATWGYGVLHSEMATTPDGKPVLFLEQRPDLTDYDYVVRRDDQNVVGSVELYQDDSEELYNWIIVERQDERGWRRYITPDDDATLTDAASVAAYGQHDYVFSAGEVSEDVAIARGVRFLGLKKDPAWKMRSPLRVMGYIRHKRTGLLIPTSEIEPGKRIKFEDFVETAVFLLISMTRYNHDDQVCSISAGPLDDAVRAFVAERPVYAQDTGGAGSGGSSKHVYEHMGMKRKDWVKLSTAQKLKIKQEWWAKRAARRGRVKVRANGL